MSTIKSSAMEFKNHRIYEYTLAGRPLVIETGKLAGLANGSCLCRYGETAVLCCATASEKPRDGIDFLPLSVDFDAAGQDCLLGGLTLALEVTAGDLTGSVHSLVEVHGQGQKVDAVAGLLGSGGAAENGGVAVAAEAGAVGEACELARLNDEGTARQGVLVLPELGELHLGADDAVHGFFPPFFIFVFQRTYGGLALNGAPDRLRCTGKN